MPLDGLGIRGLSDENAVVRNEDGEQIPRQFVAGADGRPSLIFQADVKAGGSAAYTVSKGEPRPSDTLVYSRHFPERKDDYAYENNVIVGRIYGPALKSPRTFGPDVWIKNTPEFVFGKWLARGDIHRNHGEGMDCYMVGNALGGGACAPVAGDRIVVGDNYLTWRRLSDGPLRTEAEFTCPPFDAGGVTVTASRSLSLDANTRLVHWTTVFDADADSLDVVVGAVLHDAVSVEYGGDYVAFTERASDSRNPDPEQDGLISIGVILAGHFKAEPCEFDSHAVLKFRVKCGETVDYWTASGWSLGGVESPEQWNAYVREQAFAVNNPLKIVM